MYVLLSDTPVAGTVDRLARWMARILKVEVVPLVRRNYQHNAFRLEYGAFGCLSDWKVFLARHVRKADAIFVHNVFDEELVNIAFDARRDGVPIFFQYHSPPFEPPAFFYSVLERYAFDHVFAVSQGYARFVEGATAVPNIVPDLPAGLVGEKEKVLFVPHMRSTKFRWSRKFTDEDWKFLQKHRETFSDYRIETVRGAFGRDVVTHEEALFYLRCCFAVIDDVNTGLFHQTSVEALKAGCAVFCRADIVSQEEFCEAARADPLPFVHVNGVADVVAIMASRHAEKELREAGQRAIRYADEFLLEERLAVQYCSRIKPFLP